MNYIKAENERNTQPGFLNGNALQFANLFRTSHIQDGPHLSIGNLAAYGRGTGLARYDILIPGQKVELTNLFTDGHLRHQSRNEGIHFLICL